MLIAQRLRKDNICEYLLYMWQIEDLLRAYQLDIELINKEIVEKFPVRESSDRKTIYEWYESLIDMIRREAVQQSGHLQINKNVIIELDDFHYQLLKSNKVPAYNAKFIHILPLINQLKNKTSKNISDIECCFNFQYGILILKLKKAEITPQTLQTQHEISKFMVLLSKNYQLYKSGELMLDDDPD